MYAQCRVNRFDRAENGVSDSIHSLDHVIHTNHLVDIEDVFDGLKEQRLVRDGFPSSGTWVQQGVQKLVEQGLFVERVFATQSLVLDFESTIQGFIEDTDGTVYWQQSPASG